MIVCNEIAPGLWQAAARHWPDSPPDVDVIVKMTGKEVRHSAPEVLVAFPDSVEGVRPALFDVLRGIAGAVKDKRVMTVCDEGKNRSGLASALILIARGMSVEDAIATVKRNGSSPGSVAALSNAGFLRQLRAMQP